MGNTNAGMRRMGETSAAIEESKSHWSELSEVASSSNEEEVAADNRELFLLLQQHPTWGQFFKTFNYDTAVRLSDGSLEVGEKFAEGGQAELFHARVTWRDAWMNEWDLQNGVEHVVKVFKKGTRLRHLQSQLRHLERSRLGKDLGEDMERAELGKPPGIRHECSIRCGTLLEDGRLAFVMVTDTEDLRSDIDRRMKSKPAQDSGPFSKLRTIAIMYKIAKGMEWLHSQNIVHRDLKASNVLMKKYKGHDNYYVANFEYSVGVVGTGFFRAPEILQACKDKEVSQRPEVFTNAADVYSYGMTCYEVLTGNLPFEGHPANDYDLVLNGQRPEVPEYVDGWARELLNRCWQSDPAHRPSFSEIVNLVAKFEERKVERKGAYIYSKKVKIKRFIKKINFFFGT